MTQADDPIYLASCLYGLESLLEEEASDLPGAKCSRSWCELRFSWRGDATRLTQFALAQNVFRELARFRLDPAVEARVALREVFEQMPVDEWLALWARLNPEAMSVPIHVKVARSGEHAFTHKSVRELLREVLVKDGRTLSEESSPLELLVDIHNDEVVARGRLTAVPLSHRAYQVRRSDGMTDPTVARAMVRLAQPGNRDAFLDPFCGCGIIPIERALEGGFHRLVAGDIRPKRLDEARTNLSKTGLDFEIMELDAFALPFEDRTFTRIVTHPPQSDPASGQKWEAERFQTVFDELFRVMDYGGIMALFGLDPRLLTRVSKKVTASRITGRATCNVAGKRRHIFVIEKNL